MEPDFAMNVGIGIGYDLIHASINRIVCWFLTQFLNLIALYILIAFIQVFRLCYNLI